MTTAETLKFYAACGLPKPVTEFEFHSKRAWRFDFAWPEYKIALEVEGGIHSGGRHIQPQGFLGDMEKYNNAAVLGWRVLRFTPKGAFSLAAVQMVRQAIVTNTRDEPTLGRAGANKPKN